MRNNPATLVAGPAPESSGGSNSSVNNTLEAEDSAVLMIQDLGETIDLPADTLPTTPLQQRRTTDTTDRSDQHPSPSSSSGSPGSPEFKPQCLITAIRQLQPVAQVERIRDYLARRPSHTEGLYSRADALKYAVLYGHNAYSAWLLKEHAQEALAAPVCCPLMLTAVRLDRADVVELLCRVSRQLKQTTPYVDIRGCASMESCRTALHVAAEMSSITIATTLLRYGADHRLRDQYGMTPLDRILHTLPGPHINFNTVRLAWELIRCLDILDVKTLTAWVKLSSRNPSWATRLSPESRNLTPGPFSLMQITRTKIRKIIGYPRLPDGIQKLPVPPLVQKFLNLDW